MIITSISSQVRDNNRVNISVDGKYRFSLDVYQLVDLGIKVGKEYDEAGLTILEQESQFGKVYSRSLEYCLSRPHSVREVKEYLYRKTIPKRDKTGNLRPGVQPSVCDRVLDRLIEKGYIDDVKFATFWVENRSLSKGVSQRKIIAELRQKGVSTQTINDVIDESDRNDESEIQKIIAKKRAHYTDNQKLISYLARLGFDYDDIKRAIGV